jgi:hypothetical protein
MCLKEAGRCGHRLTSFKTGLARGRFERGTEQAGTWTLNCSTSRKYECYFLKKSLFQEVSLIHAVTHCWQQWNNDLLMSQNWHVIGCQIFYNISDIFIYKIIFFWYKNEIEFNITNFKITISMFHRAFFSSIMDKTPTHALFHSTLY